MPFQSKLSLKLNGLAVSTVLGHNEAMNILETISIDVYPWPAPTDKQRAQFDALTPLEKREAISAAIEEGFSSPLSAKSIDQIIMESRAEAGYAP